MIEAAAVVAPSAAPLYLATFSGAADDEALKLHTILHCALDAVDEKATAASRTSSPPRPAAGGADAADPYLGLLYSVDEYKVYGFTSMSRVKFLLVVSDLLGRQDGPAQELRAIFKRMQAAYNDAISNPFYTPGTPLTSPRFDASIRTIVTSLGALS